MVYRLALRPHLLLPCYHEESGLHQIAPKARTVRDGLSNSGRRGRGVGIRTANLSARTRNKIWSRRANFFARKGSARTAK